MEHFIQLPFAFFLSLLLVYITIPAIVRLSKEKKLFDIPNERKVNTSVVPNLGGVALFIGISIGVLLSIGKMEFDDLRYILIALIILFFTGIKDDILVISPNKKFMLQVISAFILVVLGDIRFTSLHGFLGIAQISDISSYLFSMFVIISIINSINLIDGIDGLASGLGLMIATFFGVSFYVDGHYEYALLCFATVGGLIPFFFFNVFGKINKIFMGDTGSLILGLLFSIFIVKYNEFAIADPNYIGSYAPALSFSIVFIPMFDMARVFFLRLKNKKSPFVADQNHIHHKFIRFGYSHLKSTLILVAYNTFTIALVFCFKKLDIHILIGILLGIGLLFNHISDIFLKKTSDNSLNIK